MRIVEVIAGLLAAAALAGVYPVAGAIAKAMVTTLRTDEAAPAAPILVSTAMAERKSLGLRPARLRTAAADTAF